MTEKTITASEVAEHSTKESLWIIIDNYVYDVTEWQNEHPGGKRMLQKVGGKDATKQFHKYHDVDNIMRKFGIKYRIGKLSDIEANPASNIAYTNSNAGYTNASSPSIPPMVTATETSGTDKEYLEPLEEYGDLIPFADPMWYQGYLSPYFNEYHAKLRDRIRAWVDEHIQPYVDDWEAQQEIPEQLYRDFGRDGWLPYLVSSGKFMSEYAENKHIDIVPEDKFDGFASTIVMDELCRAGSGSIAWFLGGGFGIGFPPVFRFASDEVKKRVLPPILRGEKRICLCITEPKGGSDVAQLETSATLTPDGKHYIVSGEKKWITNGVWADYFSVAVRTGKPGMGGISMLLIEKTMPGINVRKIQTQGMRCSGSTFIEFDEVKVPVTNLIGRENQGFKVIMSNFNHERIGVITQAMRFSRVCYEEAIKWSFERETFGVKLFKHAVIRNKLAQMASRIEAAQASLDFLIFNADNMDPEVASLKLGGHIAGLKAFSTQTFEYVAREASQIFGGLSYTQGGKGGKVERLYRDVRALAIPGGSEEIMLDLAIRQSVKVQQIFGAKL